MIHTCHHPLCDVKVSPSMLACRKHWYQLPKHLRDDVWRTYVAGQEITKSPSKEYMEVIARVQKYWRSI